MYLIQLRYYIIILASAVRGFLFNIIFLPCGNGNRLMLGRNFFVRGKMKLGRKVVIGSNVKVTHNISLGNNVRIDDNVELRSSKHSSITVGNNTSINRNTVLIGEIHIGSNVSIAPGCVIVGTNHKINDLEVPIKNQGNTTKGLQISDNVWLGANVTVLDGVTIEQGSVIGAGSVVTKSITMNSIAVGNPCKAIKKRR
jgi:acetyltransferase-like isoleucine patch superfamily enzyme